MKSFLIIGMGSFGHHLCRAFASMKCEIMIVDKNSEALEDMLSYVVSAKVADCTKEEVVRSFDIPSFSACFVCIGSDFESSLEITDILKELGAKKVFSKADKDIQAKFLLKSGADSIIYPEKETAIKTLFENFGCELKSVKIFDYGNRIYAVAVASTDDESKFTEIKTEASKAGIELYIDKGENYGKKE